MANASSLCLQQQNQLVFVKFTLDIKPKTAMFLGLKPDCRPGRPRLDVSKGVS